MLLLALLLMALTNMGVTFPAGELPRGADLVLTHGKIWTGEPNDAAGQRMAPAASVEAVAISNGRILGVGARALLRACVGPTGRELALEGRMAMPGRLEAQVHFIQAG